MIFNKLKLLGIFLFLFTTGVSANGVERSWDKALVYTPNAIFSKSTGSKIEEKLPVVIYLHGCTGIYPQHDVEWAKYIAGLGFIVVMPDSMARTDRRSNCDPKAKGGTNAFPKAYEYRQQEIGYALEQLKNVSWADNKNIFLMGHSEGGIATAQSNYAGFNGIIISGWTCTNPNKKFNGIFSPKETPVLAIAYVDDAWRKGKPNEGRCANQASGRDIVQLDLEGTEHSTFQNKLAQSAVAEFLKKYLIR